MPNDNEPVPNNSTVQLKDTTTGQLHSVPLADLQDALASGKYEKADNSVVNVNRLGTTVSENPEEAQSTLQTGNESFVNPSVIANSQTLARQREAFNNVGDKALTFAEGITDALTFGLAHERSDTADIRRDVNSGSAWAGEITGIALGLVTGTGEAQLGELGEQLGKGIATKLFGAEGRIASIGGRAFAEAGANAAISAAQATGHQAFNALLEDKPFAAEAIVHEAGMGALLGAGFGAIGGLFAKGGSQASVEAGINAPDFISNAKTTLNDAVSQLDSTLATHSTRLDILGVASDNGVIPKDFLAARRSAFEEASTARADLVKLGDSDWALNGTPKQAQQWHEALERYNAAVDRLDKVMAPTTKEFGILDPAERLKLDPLEANQHINPSVNPDDIGDIGLPAEDIKGLNEHMAASPELRARYEEIYGEPWQPVEQFNRNIEHDQGDANLGGKETETSSNETNPGARNRARARQAEKLIEAEPTTKIQQGLPSRAKYAVEAARAVNEAVPKDLTSIAPIEPQPLPGLPARSKYSIQSVKPSAGPIPDNTLPGLPGGRASEFTKIGEAQPVAGGNPRDLTTTQANILSKPGLPVSPKLEGYKVESINSGLPRDVAARDLTTTNVKPRKPSPFEGPDISHRLDNDHGIFAGDLLKRLDEESKPYYFANPEDRYGRLKNLLDNWWKESKRTNLHQPTPGQVASNTILDQLNALNQTTGGRLDAVDALGMARKNGFGEAQSELGRRFQQVWSINKLTKEAAEASRIASEKAATSAQEVKDKLIKGVGAKLGIGLGGAVVGGGFGGTKGAVLGASLTTGYLAFTGKLSSAMAKLADTVTSAGEAILAGRRSTVIAIGINKPWQYSDRGPIKDPIDRIQDIHHLAANPNLIEKQVRKNLGDLAAIHPETTQLITQMTQDRIMKLSIRAPKFVWDKLGQPLQPGANAMRKFLEYENSVNDLQGTLKAFQSGTITKDSADGLRDSWPSIHRKLSVQLLNNPDQLKSLDPIAIRNIETVVGVSLSNRDNGSYLSRQQLNWQSAHSDTQSKSPAGPSNKPQSFKISNQEATGTQSLNGRAPGN